VCAWHSIFFASAPVTAQAISAPKRISEIRVEGSTQKTTVLQALPYAVGDEFDVNDKTKSRRALDNVFNTGRVDTAKIEAEDTDSGDVILYVVVTEKPRLKDIVIEGNKHVSLREIYKKLPFNDLTTMNSREQRIYAQQIKELLIDKGYLNAVIDTELRTNADCSVNAYFKVQEGYKTLVTRIDFAGNCAFSAKELRTIIITKEDWLLSILDKSGTYHPEKIEADKYLLEQFYHNQGYIDAKVSKVDMVTDKYNKRIHLTYHVIEGDKYCVGTVKAVGNDVFDEEFLTSQIPLRTGMVFSREAVNYAMKALENFWGEYGYIFARIQPMVVPNKDTLTVDVTLTSDIGNEITLRKITIKGNKKTRDKVIRRMLTVQEGKLITKRLMQTSQRNVSSLGYFEPKDGVNWKVIKQTENTADLDLIVKEAKTGHFGFSVGYGAKGGKESKKTEDNEDQPEDKKDKTGLWDLTEGLSATIDFSESNFMGYGTRISASGNFARDHKTFLFNLAQPWLFDKPIMGGLTLYHKRPSYTQMHQLRNGTINEQITGGGINLGYVTPSWLSVLSNFHLSATVGLDGIHYPKHPLSRIFPQPDATVFYQTQILDKEFKAGQYVWIALNAEQDKRNHPVHTSQGHWLRFSGRVGIPSLNSGIGYYTLDASADWYTPLIGDYDLIFHLHGYAGIAQPIGCNTIPYERLYHIGGDTSVRGYTYGQIGPMFRGDSIGSTKGFFVNAELIFPINPSMTMKGVMFYDGGAGWDNPYVPLAIPPTLAGFIQNNNFDYRHSIGIGIRLLQPMPIRIDWGFKIDPRPGESSYEVHFSTTYDW
jgi:outer membrane protein insertion porin family